MNLLDDPWIPVRRADGSKTRIRPAEVVEQDNRVVAVSTQRPDFDGALVQFLIGLLQTVAAPADEDAWYEWLEHPPSVAQLESLFAPVRHAFQLDGDGPRFMQDFDPDLGGNPVEKSIDTMLIDAPAEKALKDGTDLFQKRERIQGLCPSCAATALLTLMINAPSGGQGHRTSLRGGGPLTTLVVPDDPGGSLWSLLWWNILEQPDFLPPSAMGMGTEVDWFPWLSVTRTSEQGQVITAANAHPAVAFWATPRRIRLEIGTRTGACDLCGSTTPHLLRRYWTRPYGMNCTDWLHPLSPYYANKGTWLPVHPQPGGLGYRHWLSLTIGKADASRPANVVTSAYERKQHKEELRLWSFGYDMDNMKARCWYEARMPLMALSNFDQRQLLSSLAEKLVEAATVAKDTLVSSLKKAWSSDKQKHGGDMTFITSSFWSRTEQSFYDLIHQFATALQKQPEFPNQVDLEIRERWLEVIAREAMNLFDVWATSGAMEFENPKRIANAYNNLRKTLFGSIMREKKLGLASKTKTKGATKTRSQP
ncbi:MAG: type I-E CRISPR-associated protein Cse1/CasA [Magnetococcales bacterium]|nr:type I-E CRISPR-associated protein Cse1/CasA [Magnetococcales bacterium]